MKQSKVEIEAALSKKELAIIERVEREREEMEEDEYYEGDQFSHGAENLGLDYELLKFIDESWFFMTTWENEKGYWKEVKDLEIPKYFKTPNKSILYRGLFLSEKALNRFEKGKGIRLGSVTLSSWTELKSVAQDFTHGHGVVISMPISKLDIWICLQHLYPYLTRKDRYTQGMKEVIVYGTGVPKNILMPDIVVWSKFTKKGKLKVIQKRR
jgi:hypothetical protein